MKKNQGVFHVWLLVGATAAITFGAWSADNYIEGLSGSAFESATKILTEHQQYCSKNKQELTRFIKSVAPFKKLSDSISKENAYLGHGFLKNIRPADVCLLKQPLFESQDDILFQWKYKNEMVSFFWSDYSRPNRFRPDDKAGMFFINEPLFKKLPNEEKALFAYWMAMAMHSPIEAGPKTLNAFIDDLRNWNPRMKNSETILSFVNHHQLTLRGKHDLELMLDIAVDHNESAVAAGLLALGLDPNKLYRGETFAMRAAWYNSTSALKALIAAGADINKIVRHQTAAMRAASYGSLDVLQHLVANGAKIDGDINPMASAMNRPEIVKYLLSIGADPNAKVNKRSLLEIALFYSNESLRILLEAGANPNTLHSCGGTMVYQLISYNDLEKLKIFFEFGAASTSLGDKNRVPLILAVTSGKKEIVDLLLEQPDIDVNEGNKLDTPLFAALMLGESEIAQRLLERGANPFLEDFRGRNAFEVARELRKPELSSLLSKFNTPTTYASNKKR